MQIALPMISNLIDAPAHLDGDLHLAPAAPALSADGEALPMLGPVACDAQGQSPRLVNSPEDPPLIADVSRGQFVALRDTAAQTASCGPPPALNLELGLQGHSAADHGAALVLRSSLAQEPTSPPHPIQELLSRLTSPVSAPLLAGPRSPPSIAKHKRARHPPATATRRSLRLQGRKEAITGGGNTSLRLARRLLVEKRGLAIAEPGEEEEEEALESYKLTFKKPLSDRQIEALSALAKSASVRNARRGRRV